MNKPSNMVKVAVVGGEGIGPEVTAQSHRILDLDAGVRTADIAEPGTRKLSTVEMGDAVLSALDKVAGREREHA